jgi:hypothetical protein
MIAVLRAMFMLNEPQRLRHGKRLDIPDIAPDIRSCWGHAPKNVSLSEVPYNDEQYPGPPEWADIDLGPCLLASVHACKPLVAGTR